jgi:hypothetical protein
MNFTEIWLNVEQFWRSLDNHPYVNATLTLLVLVFVALLLGRLGRFLIQQGVRLLGRQASMRSAQQQSVSAPRANHPVADRPVRFEHHSGVKPKATNHPG